jgi:hypothetical protein
MVRPAPAARHPTSNTRVSLLLDRAIGPLSLATRLVGSRREPQEVQERFTLAETDRLCGTRMILAQALLISDSK